MSIPVVFLTTVDSVAEQATKLGAAYLNKPVTVDRLLEVLAQRVKTA